MNVRQGDSSFCSLSSRLVQLEWSFCANSSVISVATTSDCSFIVAGAVDRKIRLISRDGQLLWERELDNEVWSVSISLYANAIAAGTANKQPSDGTLYVFSLQGKQLWKFNIGSPIWSTSLSADGHVLAASCWNNHAYRFHRINGTYTLKRKGRFGDHGLYGIKTFKDGSRTIIAAYDTAITQLDSSWNTLKHLRITANTGLYNLALCPQQTSAAVGCRDGTFVYIPNIDMRDIYYSTSISVRPICGISLAHQGLVACGSFDGQLFLTTRTGKVFWRYQTYGEVWSTSISEYGDYVCAGSGDHHIYLFHNFCNSSVVRRIEGAENSVASSQGDALNYELGNLLSLYSDFGLIEYAVDRIYDLVNTQFRIKDIYNLICSFIESNQEAECGNYRLSYILGATLKKLGNYKAAITHYQTATADPTLYSRSMISAGECFFKLGYSSAARSCFRRAIMQSLDISTMNILYNLARSYEDTEDWEEATTIYEVILSWNCIFRNSWERLETLKTNNTKSKKQCLSDYTGLTVNLLGVDAPRNDRIDPQLSHIMHARSKELSLDRVNRDSLMSVFDHLCKNYKLPLALRKRDSLGYDEVVYLKYDYLPSEDESKKQLEMLYELSIIDQNPWIKNALDIGAATGRHPMLLADRGINSFGVDIETQAMQYAKRMRDKLKPFATYPLFCVGDSLALPIRAASFDYVSCMMGTFAHIPIDQKKNMLLEVYRVLNKSGIFVMSTWDIECNHVSYLSIYNEEEKNCIRMNSLPLYDTLVLYEQCNFHVDNVFSFMMVPNVFTYDLRLESLNITDLKLLAEVDLAVRTQYPKNHGEMFMVVAIK